MKIALLEIRERTANQRIENLVLQLNNSDVIITELKKNNKDLESNLLKTKEHYYCEKNVIKKIIIL